VSKQKQLLIGVDLQNDFMNDSGALSVSGAEEIKPIVEFINSLQFEKENIVRIFTADLHNLNDPELSDSPDFKTTFPPHCLVGTPGSKLIDEIGTSTKGIIFNKNKFSIFEGNPNFIKYLRELRDISNIFVYGVAGDVCVSALIDGLIARKLELGWEKLFIIYDAIASINSAKFENYLKKILQKDGIHLISSNFLSLL